MISGRDVDFDFFQCVFLVPQVKRHLVQIFRRRLTCPFHAYQETKTRPKVKMRFSLFQIDAHWWSRKSPQSDTTRQVFPEGYLSSLWRPPHAELPFPSCCWMHQPLFAQETINCACKITTYKQNIYYLFQLMTIKQPNISRLTFLISLMVYSVGEKYVWCNYIQAFH